MFSPLSMFTVADDESKQRYINNENWSDRKMWISGTNFVSKKDIIIVKTKYPISCKPSGRYFEKSKLPPCNTAHIITSHVIRIRLLHLLEIWLVTFRIYDIYKIKHILSKNMISINICLILIIFPLKYIIFLITTWLY